MMKINLSDENGQEKKNEEEQTQISYSEPDIEEPMLSETDTESMMFTSDLVAEDEEPGVVEKTSGRSKMMIPILAGLLVVLVVAVGFLQKDFILGLFVREAPVVEPVAPPPPPPPEPEVVESEPDPTFVALNDIGEAVKSHLWLTSAVIAYDGTYNIKGMSFTHEAMAEMLNMLEGKGTITSKTIPGKMKSSEAVYQFNVDGVLSDVNVPEILDTIPPEKLVAAAETVKASEKEFGIKFSHLPEPGRMYTDRDLPFSLEGSYKGLKDVVRTLCPEGGDTRIFRMTIVPLSPGRSFDKVKASFSLKTVSSI